MRREAFELTESLLPENPLEGLEPEPDVLANITARARARRRGEPEVLENGAGEEEGKKEGRRPEATDSSELEAVDPIAADILPKPQRTPRVPKAPEAPIPGAIQPEPIPLPDIDLDDPDLISGTHATTLRADWELIQGLKRMARELSRPRKECTMGMLILHALKQTYPELFKAMKNEK